MVRTAYDEHFGVGQALSLTADVALPLPFGAGGCRFWNMEPDTDGWIVSLPDATKLATGADLFVVRADGFLVDVVDYEGSRIITLHDGEVVRLSLADGSTSAGSWVTQKTDGEKGAALTVGRVPLALVLSQDTNDLNLRTWADARGYDGVTPAALSVLWDGPRVVGSTSTSTPALDTGTWPAGTTLLLSIAEDGVVTGKGGAGGRGGDVPPGLLAAAGGAGGPALKIRVPTALVSYGTIQGGGDGGAGGAYSGTQAGGGGGGGAGFAYSQGGAPGTGGGATAGISGGPFVAGGGGSGGNAGTAGNGPGDGDAIQRLSTVTLTKIRAGTITGAETTF